MKIALLPVVVLSFLSCACLSCGARQSSEVLARPAGSSSDDAAKSPPAQPARTNLDAPASARPRAPEPTVANTVVPAAEGVDVQRQAERRRAQRERQKPDPRARAASEQANQELKSSLAPHEQQAMHALEEALVAELNRMRTTPAAYAAELQRFRNMYRGEIVTVPGYMSVRTREGTAAVDEAIDTIQSTAPMARLARSPGLSKSARAHAYRLGNESRLAREDADVIMLHKRLDSYGRVRGMFAENIGAVYRDAGLMLLELFVDDGVETRVHRFNMLGPMFRLVGVGCAPHPKYDVVCVIDLVESFDEAPGAKAGARTSRR
jgi:uncharacterized protein YkwD